MSAKKAWAIPLMVELVSFGRFNMVVCLSIPHQSILGVLKNVASGVLAPWPGSRTPPYAPPIQAAAALLDEPF
jgi:hypothetical protein